MAGAQTEASSPKVEKVKAETIKVKTVDQVLEAKERFYIGIVKDSPLDNATAGGMTFHKHIDPSKNKRNSPETYRARSAGQVVELTEKQVATIKEAVVKKMVRRRASEIVVISTGGKARPYPGDEPLAKHVYMVRLPGKAHPDAEWLTPDDGASPEPMAA